jgi:hypothetical protein
MLSGGHQQQMQFSNLGTAKIEGTATHFMKMLTDGGKGEKIPNYIIGE